MLECTILPSIPTSPVDVKELSVPSCVKPVATVIVLPISVLLNTLEPSIVNILPESPRSKRLHLDSKI